MRISLPRHFQKTRRQGQFVLVLWVALISGNLGGCKSKSTAQLLSADLSITSYVQAHGHATVGKESDFYFPMLEIYNENGYLIYRSHEAMQNAAILRGMPASIRNLRPEQQSPRLAGILEAVPEFSAHKQRVLNRHQLVVLSVEMEYCGECRIQAN